MRRMMAVLAVAAGLAGTPVGAHEKGGERAMGVVESVTAERIVIKASDGHLVEFAVTPETRFFRGEKAARPDDVRVGQRAVVQGKRAGERVEAVRVKLAAVRPSRR